MNATMKTITKTLLNGFHGQATIELAEERVISVTDEYGYPAEAVWMDAAELAANQPCGMADCVCGDALVLMEAKNDDWMAGPCLVRLF